MKNVLAGVAAGLVALAIVGGGNAIIERANKVQVEAVCEDIAVRLAVLRVCAGLCDPTYAEVVQLARDTVTCKEGSIAP